MNINYVNATILNMLQNLLQTEPSKINLEFDTFS